MKKVFDLSAVPGMVSSGMTRKQIMEATGACYATVSKFLKANGLKATRPNAMPKGDMEKMISMYRQGINMQKIANQFGVSREWVRQVLARHGITGKSGYRVNKAVRKAEAKKANRALYCAEKHGCPLEIWRHAVDNGLMLAYTRQRNSARGRGIRWSMKLGEWLSIWRESGKLELRGRGKGRYVMSRVNDSGAYEIGNVHIQLSTENNREYMTSRAQKKDGAHPGVYLMYPGFEKSWVAKVGKKYLGLFFTEAQAVAARADYLLAHPISRKGISSNRLGTGRGYCLSGGKFKVVIAKKYIGVFATESEAIAAKQSALVELRAGA